MSEPPSSRRVKPIVAGVTDVGRQRKHNEDHVLLKTDCGLFVVADGMGGHNAGDVASKLTTTSLGNYFEATRNGGDPPELPEEYAKLAPAAKRLAAGIRKANHDVFVISNTYQQHHGMGSTVVAVHMADDGMMHIGHVGDSRCYRIRDGEIEQLTRDHSLINDALEMKPDLGPEEIARLPKNIITRALGMKDAVKVDIRSVDLLEGDVFLLCSDGLSGMVSDHEMLEVVSLTDDPLEACELLIAEANDGGGTDNISALVIRIADGRASDSADLAPDLEISAEEEPLSGLLLDEEDEAYGLDEAAPSTEESEPGTASELAEVLGSPSDLPLDLQGAWSNKPYPVARCGQCHFELFPGNRFCVECGAPVAQVEA
jgi:PPM family protein phosphatase